jgi:hypothetical protein
LGAEELFGPKKDETARKWREIHSEELHNLYCLPNIIRVLKSRRMRWAGHEARMRKNKDAYRVLVVQVMDRDPCETSAYMGE